jgi:hypothetical protein
MIRIQILRSFTRAVSSTGHTAGDFLERARARRKGSTIVVVIALMGILSLLGLMFFTFSNQEQEAAINFSEAARLVDNPALDADVYFNWALRQIIVGPEYAEKNSVLWGRRHAILSNLFGHDATPYNGQPFSISLDGATNYVIVDMDGDGNDDTVEIPGLPQSEWPSLADFVDSPVANFSTSQGFPFERVVTAFPEPDVDYTYADINNVYLAQISYTRNPATGNTELVIKPSYHRPELFAEPDGSGGVQRDPDWATDPRWVKRLMRPHPLHVHVPQQIVPGQTYSRRFLDDANAADAAIIFSSLPGTSGGFPFLAEDLDGDGIFNEQGVWSRQGTGGPPVNYEYDVDNYRDGFRDSILMDLDFPVQIRSSDDARYIAMFSPLIIDADSLFNLNIHGNLAGNTLPATFTNPTTGGAVLNWNRISLSSMGLTPSEVNLMWGFDAIPGSGDFVSGANPFTHLNKYFGATGDPADRWVLANMLHWWLNKGAVEYGTTGADDRVIAGRLGEASKVEELRDAAGGGSIIAFNQGNNRWYFPYPGIFNRDDNRDFNEGGTQTYYIPAGAFDVGAPNVGRAQSLPFGHPLSLSGRGLFWSYGNNPALQMYQPPAASGNPSQWLQYNGMGIAGDVRWRNLQPFGGNLMTNTQFGVHGFADPGPDGRLFTADDIPFDDMMEIILENDFLQRPYGEPFTWEDAAAIMMSSGDVSNTGIQSRAIDLLAPLFDTQNCNRAVDIRRMYTTQSWDRKQFPLARLFGPGPDGQPGVANFDDNNNGVVDDPGEYGWPTRRFNNTTMLWEYPNDDARAWEFNHDIDQDGNLEFPPEFSGGTGVETAYYGYHQDNTPDPALFNSLGTIATDPFRPQLRRLLEAEWGNRSDLRLQFRLDVNQVLDVTRAGNQRPGHPYYSPLEYRPLSPHAGDSALTSVHTVEGYYDSASPNASQLPPYPPQNPQQEEFWARYDRQRMARDIYVMLYTLCGGYDFSDAGAGNDGTFPDHALAPNGGRAVYTNTQLRQMAQFAVNLVDALDRDNVTTAFEYDTNLADGWGLDDQPWVAGGPPAATPAAARTGDPTPGDRAVVYGVETQSLTFSETLWVYQAQYTGAMAMDNPRTMYDETAGDHHFLYAELRSVSPETTNLALPSVSTSKANAIWRVRRISEDTTTVPSNPPLNPTPPQQLDADTRANLPAPDNAVYFLSDSGNVQSVSPGGLFSIATGDNYSAGATSDLYVDHDADAEFDLIVPRRLGTTPVMGPGGLLPYCDLDLVHTNHQPKFALDNGSTGDFLNRIAPATSPMTLLLERRMNPDLPNLPLSANPWIVVDSNLVTQRPFMLLEADASEMDVRMKLANLTSLQRNQPLDGATTNMVAHTGDPATGMSFRFNSIKPASSEVNGNNRGTVTPFNLTQMHFNRDFASVAELLSVPLRSPRHLTRSIVGAGRVPETQRRAATGPDMAGPMFLMPTHPTNTNFNNHWHRLLGLVEVPTRMHRQLGNPLNFTRVPGRLNVNTMRHPEVMAGLIDEPQLHFEPERQQAPGVDSNANGTIDGVRDRNTTGTTPRDYWFDTLLTRDGVDPISGLVLPGTTASRPFRDAGILTGGGASSQDSLMRAHPNSTTSTPNTPATDRHLFDTGVQLGGNNSSTNYYLKNRLLSKLTGNTTTRSNVFFVYLTVRFHEVYEDPATGAARIGGRFDLNDDGDGGLNDEHRALFVLDRSDAEKAYEPATGTFRWEEIVKHRVPIN